MDQNVMYERRTSYIFYNSNFELIVLLDDNVVLSDETIELVAEKIKETVHEFLNREPEDYDVDLDTMIHREIGDFSLLGKFNPVVFTTRLQVNQEEDIND